MANNKQHGNFSRGLAIMDFILEGNGHSIVEASEKFKISRSTVETDLNQVRQEVFSGKQKNSKKLQEKYIRMKKTLSVISNQDNSNSKKAVSD